MKPSVLVLCGPDGTGKTSVAASLAEVMPGEALRIHHRPRLLPGRPQSGDTTRPHEQQHRGAFRSALKVIYVYFDFLLGWWTRIVPATNEGRPVIIERGWWDMLVDPRRYRLQAVGPLVKVLGRLLPKPDILVVLDASSEVLFQRKRELPIDELERQLELWRLIGHDVGALVIDCSDPLDTVVDRILDGIRNL